MAKSAPNPKVDRYLLSVNNWPDVAVALRKVLLGCELTEEIKWSKPCYSHEGNNIVIMQDFKDACRLMFFNGALLKDKKKLLGTQGENTRAARVMRFTSVKEIKEHKDAIQSYIREAIDLADAGIKVDRASEQDMSVPEEFEKRLNKDKKLKSAFLGLTPGRQRAYLLHFSGAKQSATRESRIDKWVSHILKGKGMNDR